MSMSAAINYPQAVPVRIGMMAVSGSPLSVYQRSLRMQEAAGVLTIVSMDDDIAWVVYHDKRVASALSIPYSPKVRS